MKHLTRPPGRNGRLDFAENLRYARLARRLCRGGPVGDEVAGAAPKPWREALNLLTYTVEVSARPGVLERWAERAGAMQRAALEEAEDDDDDEGDGWPGGFRLEVLSSAEFARREYSRRWLVEHVAVEGQPCIIGGPRKALKTSVMVDFAISLALALPFLGRFAVPRAVKVLFLSGESGDATIQETARRICAAKGIDLADLEGQLFWGFKLPSLSHPEQLAALADFIRANGIEVVIVDPLYLCLLSGNNRIDPANLFHIGPLLAQITETCTAAGATPFLVHHLRKNRERPDDPPELEDLAYAGVQEYARQWLLIGRSQRYELGSGEHRLWLNVGGSAGHSGCWAVHIAEGTIDADFGGRSWCVDVQGATAARTEARAQAEAAKTEETLAKELAQEAEFRARCDRAAAVLAEHGPLSARDWAALLKCSYKTLYPLAVNLVADGCVRECTIPKGPAPGSRDRPGYEAVPPSATPSTHNEPMWFEDRSDDGWPQLRDTPRQLRDKRVSRSCPAVGTTPRQLRDPGGLSLPMGESPLVSRSVAELALRDGGADVSHRQGRPIKVAEWMTSPRGRRAHHDPFPGAPRGLANHRRSG
jgi:hypothetical protein